MIIKHGIKILLLIIVCSSCEIENPPVQSIVMEEINDTILNTNFTEVSKCDLLVDSLLNSVDCDSLWSKAIDNSFKIGEDCPLILLDRVIHDYKSHKKHSDFLILECLACTSDGYITEMFIEYIGEISIENFSVFSDYMFKLSLETEKSCVMEMFITRYLYFDSPEVAIELIDIEIAKTEDSLKLMFLNDLMINFYNVSTPDNR